MTTPLNQWMLDNVGERCPDYEPGCPVCDAWHLYDINAFEALSIDIKSVDVFMEEWNSIVPTQWDIDNGYADGVQYELWNQANDLRIEQMIAE
jgi:hypothetical protein